MLEELQKKEDLAFTDAESTALCCLMCAVEDAPTVDIMTALRCNHCGYKHHSKAISNLNSCNDCGIQNACIIKPKPGEWCRINCYFWQKKH
ncbi:MAG: hypothetical protein RR998_08430 [Oscillospiraceae bacterium]